MHIDEVTGRVVSAAIKAHSRIGPGLLESSYEACLRYELMKRGLKVASQVPVPLIYDEVKLDIADFLVAVSPDAAAKASPPAFATMPLRVATELT